MVPKTVAGQLVGQLQDWLKSDSRFKISTKVLQQRFWEDPANTGPFLQIEDKQNLESLSYIEFGEAYQADFPIFFNLYSYPSMRTVRLFRSNTDDTKWGVFSQENVLLNDRLDESSFHELLIHLQEGLAPEFRIKSA